MSNYSERKLQQALHGEGFYTQKAPSSGHGILDPETQEYIDQADIVAIRSVMHMAAGEIPSVLVIEDKHVEGPTCPIQDDEKQQLERIQEITAAQALFSVKWKHKQGDHQFFGIDDLVDTGMHWKITEEMNGMVLHELLP